MERQHKKRTAMIAVAGSILLAAILIGGTIMMGRTAQNSTATAVRSVSLLYLDELAGRREQVVENNLQNNIRVINIALDLMETEDTGDLEHMRAYQRRIKRLFDLERFAFTDAEGMVYTADEGVVPGGDQYRAAQLKSGAPSIFLRTAEDGERKVVIAVETRGRDITVEGKTMETCFMEMSMEALLRGASMITQESSATFCNLYTHDGSPLSEKVLGGLAQEDNLLDSLAKAEMEPEYSLENVVRDFREGNRGVVSFTYNGIRETMSYVPVGGTDWMLTYLIRESVIGERISAVSSTIIWRSVIQSVLMALVLGLMFAFIIAQNRKNARLRLEKETSEAENRVKHQEMEQRIALQEQLLAEKSQQEQQAKMITALASDYRSVYYLELDSDEGICYQARSDMKGLKAGERFPYLKTMTDYCNRYVTEPFREEFLRFVQPDHVRAGLKDHMVISCRYMICVDGKESYEMVRFAGVRHPEDREDHLVHSVGACFTDVDEETRAGMAQNQVLTDALSAAEQASKAKTTFLSNMSHEIRTPMNAIIGLNSIALSQPDVPDKVREQLQQIGTSAQHLLGIINDILDMSRIESGRMAIKKEEFSFARVLEQVNNIISGQCRDKGLKYDCRTIGKIDDFYIGDELKLRQVIINILGNAVKFTPEGGTVSFLIEESRRFDGKAVLKLIMRDTGIGMSREFLPHLFDTFTQEDATAANRYGSTGLGMPITKSIVELMNGTIEVESEKGSGTTFTVTVPLGVSGRETQEAQEDGLNPKQMSVLVIDDDPVALEHAGVVLGQVGITCETAGSGAEGIEKVRLRHGRQEDYNLVLVDWKMPGMDGVETTRQIRAIAGQKMPVIILTSYNWDEVETEAREAGVDTFAPKPLFAGNVMSQFREAFRRKNEALAEATADLKGRRVMLAEDVDVNAEIMTMVLAMREIETDVAENGRVALEKYLEKPEGWYDAILMDMRMPEMDGLEATRRIRASGRADAETIPIIALTANAFDEDVQRSMQAGMNAHLSKPVEPEVLFSTLEKQIARSHRNS